ncbi:hypothetical protein GCM10027275_36860 [Rhabdobacter roseus]|uniref:Uncharacterized protein n=1 Tax=Rhabdobacter roseus TaxID=1655419 RepID=A0A840TWE1_9BACT|nr:hypothetical protein [Rhabdobacter roseus]MBB5285907.1 hypothetical protein [Rhabdobacter roseus]
MRQRKNHETNGSMKKHWMMIGLGLGSLYATAQEVPPSEKVPLPNQEYTCKEVHINTSTHQTTLLGNVDFKTDFLEIKNADTLIYDQKTHGIVALGLKQFSFSGAVYLAKDATHQRLRYKLGDTTAYLD